MTPLDYAEIDIYVLTNTLINKILLALTLKVGREFWRLGQNFGSCETNSDQPAESLVFV